MDCPVYGSVSFTKGSLKLLIYSLKVVCLNTLDLWKS